MKLIDVYGSDFSVPLIAAVDVRYTGVRANQLVVFAAQDCPGQGWRRHWVYQGFSDFSQARSFTVPILVN